MLPRWLLVTAYHNAARISIAVLAKQGAAPKRLVHKAWSHSGCSPGGTQREAALTSTARSECVEQSAAAGVDPARTSAGSTGGRPTGSCWSACQAHKLVSVTVRDSTKPVLSAQSAC